MASTEEPTAQRGPAESAPDSSPPPSSFDGEEFLYHLYRGSELLQDDCVGEAKEELERALSLQPRDVEGQGLLGVVYFRLGLYPRAITIYEEIIRARPAEITPRVNLALSYLKTGQTTQSRDALLEVLERVPGHQRAWGYLGLVYERLGEPAKALAAFERAGQPQMARRMQLLLDQRVPAEPAEPAPEAAEVRRAAAEAAAELTASDDAQPFSRAAAASEGAPSRAGRWLTREPGGDGLAPPPSRGAAGGGRLGPVIPPLPESMPPPQPAPAPAQPPGARSVQPPASGSGRPAHPAPLQLPTFGAARALGDGLVALAVVEVCGLRQAALRALVPAGPAFVATQLLRRARGRETAEPLGGAHAPFVQLEGLGHVLLGARPGCDPTVVELTDDFLYVRESALLAFDGRLRHEHGRVPDGEGDHVAVVQLSGRGAVVVEHERPVRSLRTTAERPLLARGADVLGWMGRLVPRAASPEEAPLGTRGFLAFSGDGALLVLGSPPAGPPR
ncbi:MAG: tetratricopeptide repeat protein [Polyangiaceae bacterium]|nr:tetratricopeptide repeat protein [Polyangiaceae bacterium]